MELACGTRNSVVAAAVPTFLCWWFQICERASLEGSQASCVCPSVQRRSECVGKDGGSVGSSARGEPEYCEDNLLKCHCVRAGAGDNSQCCISNQFSLDP